jgi:hypothetical protein
MNTNPRLKLTAVTIKANGRKTQCFVQGLCTDPVNGTTVVPYSVIQQELERLGVNKRGATYSIG